MPREMTKEEARWVAQFNRLMGKMPKTLLVFECASTVGIIDSEACKKCQDLSDGGADRADLILADVPKAISKIISVSG